MQILDEFCHGSGEKIWKFPLYTSILAFIRESFAFIRESFAFICESFALIRETFALIRESNVFIYKSYKLIREKKNIFSPTKRNPKPYF